MSMEMQVEVGICGEHQADIHYVKAGSLIVVTHVFIYLGGNQVDVRNDVMKHEIERFSELIRVGLKDELADKLYEASGWA